MLKHKPHNYLQEPITGDGFDENGQQQVERNKIEKDTVLKFK